MFKINILKKIFPSKSKSDRMKIEIKTHDIIGKDTEEKFHPVLRSGCEKLTNNGITRFFVTRRDDAIQVEQAHMGTKNIILWNDCLKLRTL